jgi:hypothetical protein
MLFSQLFNKRGHKLYVKIGLPVMPCDVGQQGDSGPGLLAHLREKTYALGKELI